MRNIQFFEEIDQMFDLPDVIAITRMSKTKIYNLMKDGKFPKSLKIHGKTRLWRKSDISEWIKDPENYRAADAANDSAPQEIGDS